MFACYPESPVHIFFVCIASKAPESKPATLNHWIYVANGTHDDTRRII